MEVAVLAIQLDPVDVNRHEITNANNHDRSPACGPFDAGSK